MEKHSLSEVRKKNFRVVKRALMRYELFVRKTRRGMKHFTLQEEGLLTGCDVTTFHKLLANELPDCDLKTVRNLQISIKKLNDSTSIGKIKDNGIERSLINEGKAYLAEVNN